MKAHAAKLSALRWRRTVASGLLAAMAAVLLATELLKSSGPWIRLAQAGAEAALVGGLADWFAVTALFRRPLGLPIPHTAVARANKDRIGAGLAAFMEEHFLTPDTIAATLRSLDPARALGLWLCEPEHARKAALRMTRQLPRLASSAEVGAFLSARLEERAKRADLRPLLDLAVDECIASGLHERLLDDALKASREFLGRNEERFDERATERRHGWLRKTVDRQVTRAIIRGLQDLIFDLSTPRGASRRALLSFMEERAHSLVTSAETSQVKERLLKNPRLKEELGALLAFDAADRDARASELAVLVASLGKALVADDALRQTANEALELAAVEVLPLREALTRLIADVVADWDAEGFSDRIEAAVDADLQFIRINGTVVGAIVGCLLFLARLALQ